MVVSDAHILDVVSPPFCTLALGMTHPSPRCSNMYAPNLKDDDVLAIKQSPKMGERLIESYELILDFYGMRLLNKATGTYCYVLH